MAFFRLSVTAALAGTTIVTALFAVAFAGTIALAPPAEAQNAERPFDNQIRARQGMMRIQAVNLGVLSAMARGQMEYDAETAQAAAANLAATGTIDQRFFWPAGSSLFEVDNTRAMPEIWEDYDGFLANWVTYTEAAAALQNVAGDGQEALGQGLAVVGRSCGTCHESFQQSN